MIVITLKEIKTRKKIHKTILNDLGKKKVLFNI